MANDTGYAILVTGCVNMRNDLSPQKSLSLILDLFQIITAILQFNEESLPSCRKQVRRFAIFTALNLLN